LKKWSNAASDPAYRLDADPDLLRNPTCQFDADPDSDPQHWIKVKTMASVIQSSKCSYVLSVFLISFSLMLTLALAFQIIFFTQSHTRNREY
jgi:hypothetical protein